MLICVEFDAAGILILSNLMHGLLDKLKGFSKSGTGRRQGVESVRGKGSPRLDSDTRTTGGSWSLDSRADELLNWGGAETHSAVGLYTH
jgi:hypothetical protein